MKKDLLPFPDGMLISSTENADDEVEEEKDR